jgi:hypothetical protein
MHRSWLMFGAVVLALTALACGDDDEVVDSVDSSVSDPMAGSAVPSSEDAEAWDLLYISDSSGWKAGEAYARLAEEELGVLVRLLPWRVPSMPLVQAKQMIADDPEMVAEAEIVVLGGNPLDSGTREEGVFACWPADPVQEFAPYTPQDWVPYADLLHSTFDDIRIARQGQPTVLRAVDIYVPVLAKWQELGITDECTAFQESFTAAVRAGAEAAGATMVSMYDAFNGPNHDQDPVAAGYILADGMHLSDAGGDVGGAALAAAGFAPNDAP